MVSWSQHSCSLRGPGTIISHSCIDQIGGLCGLENSKGVCLSEDITPKLLCVGKKREMGIEITRYSHNVNN